MPSRNNILVPEARQELDKLKAEVVHADNPAAAKFEAAKEVGVPLKKGYNGNLTSGEAGQIGGRLGGSMVSELIKMAKKNLL
ncbi:MAG TPA: alpha/beta-type small acid-soluble spore protein [Chondromyces sp.]|nr:alpha/beta-type small acid-soluble spore protein [Chondromyces sp.]